MALLGCALGWPSATLGQQATMPVIGFLMSGRPNVFAHLINAFRQGLNEVGFVEVETSYSSIARPVTSTTVFEPWPTIWFAEADRIPQRKSLGAIPCAPVSAGRAGAGAICRARLLDPTTGTRRARAGSCP